MDNVEEKQEPMSLAFEIYQEQRVQNKRLFAALIVVLCMWLATIGVFVWYISLPIDDVVYATDQATDSGGNNYNNIGGSFYDKTESESTEN